MQCRFCLEIGGEDLISPCKCCGSVKYIHKSCLRRWVVEEDTINYSRVICSICSSPLYRLETISYKTQLVKYILFNPVATAFLIQYITMIYGIHGSMRSFERFKHAQSVVHYIYLIMYLSHVRILNIREYMWQLLERRSYKYALLHVCLLWFFYREELVLAALLANSILSFYWHEHAIILDRVNEYIIKN